MSRNGSQGRASFGKAIKMITEEAAIIIEVMVLAKKKTLRSDFFSLVKKKRIGIRVQATQNFEDKILHVRMCYRLYNVTIWCIHHTVNISIKTSMEMQSIRYLLWCSLKEMMHSFFYCVVFKNFLKLCYM